jgi:FkbM family methyltransferase
MLRPIAAELVGSEPGLLVDVGANVGASLLQMKLGAPNSRFRCLEPSRRFVKALTRTVRSNGWTDVRVERIAAGSQRGRSTLFVNPTTASIVAAAYGGRTPLGPEEIEVRTLDELLVDEPRLDLLKIDTDGFEYDVLLGARVTLARLRPALFFELDPGLLRWGGRDPEQLLALLEEMGYRAFEAYAPGGRPLGTAGDIAELRTLAAQAPHVNVLARRG